MTTNKYHRHRLGGLDGKLGGPCKLVELTLMSAEVPYARSTMSAGASDLAEGLTLAGDAEAPACEVCAGGQLGGPCTPVDVRLAPDPDGEAGQPCQVCVVSVTENAVDR